MESQLNVICVKQSDYKICNKCGAINWYENEKCICDNNTFDESENAVDKWVTEEYEFWESEGLIEGEIDNIFVDV